MDGFHASIFDDVDRTDTHAQNINALAGLGITRGCNPPANDGYCPDRTVTRSEMASFVARLLCLGDDRPPMVDITTPANLSTHISTFNNATGFF